MKTLFLLSLMLLSLPAFGQEPSVVEPVKIALMTAGDAGPAAALDRELRAALRKLAERPEPGDERSPVDVAFVTLRPDYDVVIAVARLEDTGCVGIVSAMTITDTDGKRVQSIHSGRDAAALAAHLARRLDQRYFQQARQHLSEKDGHESSSEKPDIKHVTRPRAGRRSGYEPDKHRP